MVVVGLGVLAAGGWLLARARRTPLDSPCDPPLPLVGAVRRSTLYTMALCVMVVGYHVAAWTVPTWLALHVPARRGWILGAAVAAAVAGSILAERLERRDDRSSSEP